jgi:Deoxyribonuclease NucA/NucB
MLMSRARQVFAGGVIACTITLTMAIGGTASASPPSGAPSGASASDGGGKLPAGPTSNATAAPGPGSPAPGPGATLPAPGRPASAESVVSCSQALRSAAAKSGALKRVACIEPTSGRISHKLKPRISGRVAAPALTAGEVDLGAWCELYPGGWWSYRDQTCLATQMVATLYQVGTPPVELGTTTYNTLIYVWTQNSLMNWAESIVAEPVAFTGIGNTVSMDAGVTCVGLCTVTGADGDVPVAYPNDYSAIWYLSSTVTNPPGGVGAAGMQHTFTATAPETLPAATKISSKADAVRCDTILPGYPSGCIIKDGIPTMHYSATSTSPYDLREAAQHIADAQAGGLPGAPGTLPLERTTDTNIQTQNNNKACPSSFPTPPEPNGDPTSCDEYPFKSTYQGAWLNPYSARAINAAQNSLAGSLLGAFYNAQRLLDSDKFWVKIDDTQDQGSPAPAPTTHLWFGTASAAVPGASGVTSVFVRGSDGNLYDKDALDGGWGSFVPDAAPPGTTLASDPVAVYDSSGSLWVFARGTDSHLYNRLFTGGAWTNWQSLGGTLTGRPHALLDTSNMLRVFVRGTDGTVYEDDLHIGAGTWSGLQSTGIVGASDAVPIEDRADIVRVYTTDAATHLRERYLRPGQSWSSWGDLGCCIIGTPMPIVDEANIVRLYVRGTNNSLFEKFLRNGAWSGYSFFNISTAGEASAMVDSDGVVWLFAADLSGRTQATSLPPDPGALWVRWQIIATGTAATIAATQDTDKTIFIFTHDSDNTLGIDTLRQSWSGLVEQPGLTLGQ